MMEGYHLRAAAVLVVLALGAAGCDVGNQFPDQPVAPSGGTENTGSIAGQVLAATGVGGAQIRIIDGDSTTTDAGGNYRFSRVPSGSYRLSVAVPQGFAIAPGDSATKGATVRAGQQSVVNFTLVRSGPGL